jgi:putative transposase
MTSLQQRSSIVSFVQEAIDNGVQQNNACNTINLKERTYQRWSKSPRGDLRPITPKTNAKKITEAEEQNILDVCNDSEFCGDSPNTIVPRLADKGVYIASESMFYRVLKAHNLLKHRANSKPPQTRKKPPQLFATGPGQVWSWDITYLKRDIHGVFYYLYLFMDVWSRFIVGWTIEECESGDIAADTLEKLCTSHDIEEVWLHSDNGSPMKCGTMLARMEKLGVLASFSRPAVSNDNPFSESLFKTLKYRPGYPGVFKTINDANLWVEGFVHWYNKEHLHSGIKYVTPFQRHTGVDIEVLKRRQETYEQAYLANPARWPGKRKNFDHERVVVLNGKYTKNIIEKIS